MSLEPSGTIESVAEGSRLWRGVENFARTWTTAWDHSSVGRLVARSTTRVRQATPAARLRTGASIAAWACGWYLVSLMVLPRYATSGLPRMLFVAAGIMALLAALAADDLVRAWEASALRRMLSRFDF
jgi:predicted membrane channel-forming protein YqfA (hemolysin III family)